MVQLAFTNRIGIGLLFALLLLKPLVTAACLGSGAPGGLLTPTLALGALLGAILGHGWSVIWPGAPIASYAVIGGGAVLAAAMQGPLTAVVLILEFTHTSDGLMVPILLAATTATIVARLLGAPSIYSARLTANENQEAASVESLADIVPAVDIENISQELIGGDTRQQSGPSRLPEPFWPQERAHFARRDLRFISTSASVRITSTAQAR